MSNEFATLSDGTTFIREQLVAIEDASGCLPRSIIRLTGGHSIEVRMSSKDVRGEIFGPEVTTITPLENAAINVREATRKHAEARAAYRAAIEAADKAHDAMYAAGNELHSANQALAEVAAR